MPNFVLMYGEHPLSHTTEPTAMNQTYCVIMAGGGGTRFWPVSRTSRPKQFLDMLGTGKTFLRSTFERFAPFIPAENFLVVTSAAHKQLAMEQLPELTERQILTEPLGRNTATCIAYAAFRLQAICPHATMIVTPADHLILNETVFRSVIEEAADFASTHDALVTIGVHPTRPATGYGYIQTGKAVEGSAMRHVRTFTEKPNAELAQAFLKSGDFVWNSGIFLWQTDIILRELEKLMPDTYYLFRSAGDAYGTPEENAAISRIYPECQSISIDYAVMEKADNVYVRCSDFGWSDIGTWDALYDYLPKDEAGNTADCETVTYDASNCLVRLPKGKLAVIDGLSDYIIVDTPDALLICPKGNEQNIKRYIDAIKYHKKGERYI